MLFVNPDRNIKKQNVLKIITFLYVG